MSRWHIPKRGRINQKIRNEIARRRAEIRRTFTVGRKVRFLPVKHSVINPCLLGTMGRIVSNDAMGGVFLSVRPEGKDKAWDQFVFVEDAAMFLEVVEDTEAFV